ncbi:protein phosphatase 1 regulatory subunit 26 [Pholidichthys leucotaenia]
MYLMNVPPVAVTQTEWRTCGSSGGYSPPVCFNDSESELSTRGSPISDKVQMIIESLRSTQSSHEMGDEIEGTVLPGGEGHPQVCKVAVGSYTGVKSETKSPSEDLQVDVSSTNNHGSSDSDSDDSVDRGIEEAILEYLKEKDGYKHKAEPCSTLLSPSKIPMKKPPIPKVSTQNSDCSSFPTARSTLPKVCKTETATVPIKKYIKNKASLNENAVKNFDSNGNTGSSLFSLKEQVKINETVKCPISIKVEEHSDDSSSDDGIEEAIQRYQLEKMEQQNIKEAFNLYSFKEEVESDSTSDDGIEEAIRSYQLEQLKKSALKPFLPKQKPYNKSFLHPVASTSMETVKKNKLRRKKGKTEMEVKSIQPPPLSVFTPKTVLPDGLKSAPPKVNTTAELMCAEAILDISKTVMPGAFNHSIDLSSCVPTNTSFQSPLPDLCPYEESNDSSVDSDDGIEQEIRKFLEQKAQMHKQAPISAVTQEACLVNEEESVKANKSAVEKKPSRLSLTQRRKHKEKNASVSSMPGKDDTVKETQLVTDHTKHSNLLMSSQRIQTHRVDGFHRKDQSGDKSSSLDSDEDLDTAIKDLLKTKKMLKKKTRDLKRKSRKCLKDEDPVLQTKKLKLDLVSKCSALKKVHKSKKSKGKSGVSKESSSQHKQINQSKELDKHEGKKESMKEVKEECAQLMHDIETPSQIQEDSSSVDSDDSIEQEIRRFLAEKAKGSTAENGKVQDVSRNGTATVGSPIQDKDIKQENQLAEIPRKSISPNSGQFPLSTPQSVLPENGAQSRLPSVQPCSSPGLMEPADGAGMARMEQKGPNSGRGGDFGVRPSMSHSLAESIKWRQSLGLPTGDRRPLSRTSFHITSSESGDATSPSRKLGDVSLKLQTPGAVWSSPTSRKSPFTCSTEPAVNATLRSSVLSYFPTPSRLPTMSFMRSLTTGHRTQCSMEGEKESMVQISKDKSVFVELESNKTNHVQVQCRERSEGRERGEKRREGESVKMDDKEAREKEFIDESVCESGSRKNPEKEQGFSIL